MLSTPQTWWPCSESSSATLLPMKPATPVARMRMFHSIRIPAHSTRPPAHGNRYHTAESAVARLALLLYHGDGRFLAAPRLPDTGEGTWQPTPATPTEASASTWRDTPAWWAAASCGRCRPAATRTWSTAPSKSSTSPTRPRHGPSSPRRSPRWSSSARPRVGGILANSTYPYEFIQENLGIELNLIHEAYRSRGQAPDLPGQLVHLPAAGASAAQGGVPAHRPAGRDQPALRRRQDRRHRAVPQPQPGVRHHYLSLMPTNMYGPGDNFDLETSHLVPALIRKFHEGKTAGDPGACSGARARPKRELMHVDDLAAAVCMFMESEDWREVPDALVNIGTGKDHTIAELAETVRRVVGYEGEVQWDASKPDGTPQKLLDVSLARSLGLGRPQISLEDGLRRTYEWYVRNRS